MLKSKTGFIALFCIVGATAAYGVVKQGILNPDMTPQAGTYEKPAAVLGETPSAPWSSTTVEASVNGKPLPGKVVTRVGEIVDYSCYLQLGKHGAKHKDCGQKCLRNGMPIGLLTKNGTLYLLMEEEHHPRRDGKTNFREMAVEHVSDIVEVHGTESDVDRQRAIYVTGFVNK